MVCRSKGEQLMILSHKEIEEIAAAVTEDFNEFFFGSQVEEVQAPRATPIDQLAKDLRLMPIQSTQLRKEALSANLRSGKIKFCWMRVLFSPDKFGRFAENADSH